MFKHKGTDTELAGHWLYFPDISTVTSFDSVIGDDLSWRVSYLTPTGTDIPRSFGREDEPRPSLCMYTFQFTDVTSIASVSVS